MIGAAITAVSMALAQAGILCLDLVVASSVCKIKHTAGVDLIVDPNREEQSQCSASSFIAYMPNIQKITSVISEGKLDSAETIKMLDFGVVSCKDLHAQAKSFLLSGAPP